MKIRTETAVFYIRQAIRHLEADLGVDGAFELTKVLAAVVSELERRERGLMGTIGNDCDELGVDS